MQAGIEILLDRETSWDDAARRRLRGRNLFLGRSPLAFAREQQQALADLFRRSFSRGLAAAKSTAVPAMFVQGLMLAIVVGYYCSPQLATALGRLTAFKQECGSAFSFVSMGLISVFAELFRIRFAGEKFNRSHLLSMGFGFLVFGCMGLIYDAFNHLQERVWGGLAPTQRTLAKVATDQFVYTIIFAHPYQTLLYVWKDEKFDGARFVKRVTPLRRFYVREMFAVLVTNWAFWIPMTAIIYCLPVGLQFMMCSLAIGIWVLLLTALTAE